jgi:hypothetical protein
MDRPPRVTANLPGRLREEGGFALAMAIFALVLLAAVIAGGYYSASQEFQIGRGMRSLTTSFYAGEAGIREVLMNWDADTMSTIAAGSTITFGPRTFPGGGSYVARVTRVGSAADSLKRYFYIEAAGRPPGPNMGERRQAMVVRARFPDLCCDYAMNLYDDLILQGSASNFRIDGQDSQPTDWMGLGVCDRFTPHDTAAVSHRYIASIAPDSAYLHGNPDYVEEYPPVGEGVIYFPGYTWNDLTALADHVFEGSVSSQGIATLDADGECNRGDPTNWGEPVLDSHPCFDYFPIIHVKGPMLNFENGARAQGIFLAEEDVAIENNAEVYGIILVRNDLFMSNKSIVWGMGWVADDAIFSGVKPEWNLSSCAAKRAILLSNLARPTPVSPRAWVELF